MMDSSTPSISSQATPPPPATPASEEGESSPVLSRQAIDGFAIDSDDEDDDDDVGATLVEASTNKASMTTAEQHPLQDGFTNFLITTVTGVGGGNNTTQPTAPPVAASPPIMNQQQPPAAANPAVGIPHPLGATTPPRMANPQQQQYAATTPTGSGVSGVSFDQWKSHTSRFASNVAAMAQRAATQVATAAERAVPQGQQPYHHGVYQQPHGAAPLQYGAPVPTQQQQPSIAPIVPSFTDMGTEQKEEFIRKHVGELHKGERIIMFVANLLYVSDSTAGFQYYYSPPDPNNATGSTVIWCCAMTFYRIFLFRAVVPYDKETPLPTTASATECPSGWNACCWPSDDLASPKLIELPLGTLEHVEKSVFSASMVGASGMMNKALTNGGSPPSGGAASATTTVMGLQLYSKLAGRVLRFSTATYADTMRAFDSLNTYAFPGKRQMGYFFAFESRKEEVMASCVEQEGPNGTKVQKITTTPVAKRFDAVTEFTRQMYGSTTSTPDMSQVQKPWTVWTALNASYQTCNSYPNTLAGPISLSENNADAQRLIQDCASFRSEGRFPVLTWASDCDGASLWRAAQPKVGLQGNRNASDELYLKHVMESAASANALAQRQQQVPGETPIATRLRLSPHLLMQFTGCGDSTQAQQQYLPESFCKMKILDLRPRSAAMANRTAGYGYENTSHYPGTTLQFCNIANIHGVRDAYQKLVNACQSTNNSDLQWTSSIEDTKWLQHVRLILQASWETAYWVHVHRLPVFIHCSHGWDRTGQVAVLAQLMLDPYYRTQKGFACLIEKDFLAFGHPFQIRCAHGEGRRRVGGSPMDGAGGGGSDSDQVSPIFLQFLDCCWQLINLYPEAFEITEAYLAQMSLHLYSCMFGTFLCDNEREREFVTGIRQRTHSVWDYLETLPECKNPKYSAATGGGVLLMPLPTLLRNVTLWQNQYCRHATKPTMRWTTSRDRAASPVPSPSSSFDATTTAVASEASTDFLNSVLT